MGICKDSQDFGRGFMGFVGIHEDLWGFAGIHETLGEDS